ncbi:helix-turn-helix domain-containing protein [uncultured Aquimarina sp.]|uniref:AraC family transcriptional regulator n=1 Tax=uncultured Aquimarina sp. TaxID=575652 RepID=UPI00261AC60A|nr:helix-turn-helix domain-containing protein [uncultured Aquimarina sp.]
MDLTFLDILIALGLALSFFLVVLIFISKSFRRDVNNYFAIAIIALNFFLIITQFEDVVPANGVLELISWEFLFPFAFLMFSLKAIRHPLSSNKKIWFLGLPFILFSSFQIIDFFFNFDMYDWLSGYNQDSLLYLIEVKVMFFLCFSTVIIGFSYFKIRNTNTLYRKEKKWLKLNSLFLLSFLLVWIFSEVIDSVFDFPIWEYLLAILGIFLILITYFGVHHLNVSEQRQQISKLTISNDTENNTINTTQLKPQQEDTSLFHKINKKTDTLISLMEKEKYYLDSNITRSIVAKELGISDGYLSEILKTDLNTNFNDFVNGYRVNQTIKMFHDKSFDIFTLEAIGYEAGFKSKSVFYKSFRKVTKKSPGVYRKLLKTS